MTENKPIIDGVDVSRCKVYFCGDCNIEHDGCAENPNCYYKQLKRKEQECERIAAQYNEVVKQNKDLQTESKQEKNKSSLWLNKYNMLAEEYNQKLLLLEDLRKFQTYWDKIEQKNNELLITEAELKQKLERIKEIANNIVQD